MLYVLTRDIPDFVFIRDFVIRAENKEEAKKLANKHCGDEGKIWNDCKIEEIEDDGTGVDIFPRIEILEI